MHLIEFLYFIMNFRFSQIAINYIAKFFNPRKDVMIKVGNHELYANTLDRIFYIYLHKYLNLGSYELELMDKIIEKGMIVIDIGANIGIHALHLANLVGPEGKVYAFEPEPRNFSLLVRNIKKNNYNNIIPVQKAVTNKTEKTSLFLCEGHSGDHRLFDSVNGRKAIEIETERLDDYLVNNERVNFIKMDIQGSEHLAFLGMENIINKNAELIIFCEFSPFLLKKCHSSGKQFLNLITKLGFDLKYINEKKNRLEAITSEKLNVMCNDTKLYDYVMLYLEKKRHYSNPMSRKKR